MQKFAYTLIGFGAAFFLLAFSWSAVGQTVCQVWQGCTGTSSPSGILIGVGTAGPLQTAVPGVDYIGSSYYSTTTHGNISSLPSLSITESQISDLGAYLTDYNAWTHDVAGTSATTTELRFGNGFVSQASSTVSGALTVTGNSTFDTATFNDAITANSYIDFGGVRLEQTAGHGASDLVISRAGGTDPVFLDGMGEFCMVANSDTDGNGDYAPSVCLRASGDLELESLTGDTLFNSGFVSQASSTVVGDLHVDTVQASSTSATSTFPRLSITSAFNFLGSWVDSIKDVFHFDKTITVCSDESCDYVTDGSADQVQINEALLAASSTGAIIQLFDQTYNISAPIELKGETASVDANPTIRLLGCGADCTNLKGNPGVTVIEISNEPKFELGWVRIETAGNANGINMQASDERGTWVSHIHDIHITTDFGSSGDDSWGIKMESPFRMRFTNIEMNGVRNGLWFTAHTDSFHPGNLSVDRLFIDLWNDGDTASSTAIKITSNGVDATGHNNLMTFNRVDIFGGNELATTTGIHLQGGTGSTGEVRHISFNNLNIEQVKTAFHLEAAPDNTFTDISYTKVHDGGTFFLLDSKSTNNHFENAWLDTNEANATFTIIDDSNTDVEQPNVFRRIVGNSTSTATLNANTTDATMLEHIDLTEGSPTIDADLDVRRLAVHSATSTITNALTVGKSFTVTDNATISNLLSVQGTGTSTFSGGMYIGESGGSNDGQLFIRAKQGNDTDYTRALVLDTDAKTQQDGGPYIEWRHGGQSVAKIFGTSGSGNTNPYLAFLVGLNSGEPTEAARFDENKNLGIGHTSPPNKLTVSGTASAQNFVATSTTATSTFAGGLTVSAGGLQISNLTNCDTIDTDASGNLKCGSDETGGGGSFEYDWEQELIGGTNYLRPTTTITTYHNAGFLSVASSTVTSTLTVTGGVIGNLTGDVTGNADTATALAANGVNCSAGSYPLGVDASGAAEDCTDATTEINSAIATHAADDDAHQALVTLAGALDYLTISGQQITRNAIDLTTDVTDVLPEANGGTNQSTYTQGDILYASAANTLSKLTVGASSTVLMSNGTIPAWNATSSLGFLAGGDIDTYSELNSLVADVTLTHNGLIDTYSELNAIVADVTLTHNGLIDTFAELDAIVADKALVNKADGAVWSGAHDYGGATSLEIPNGTDPTADDPGELAHDTTDNQLILDDTVIARGTKKLWSVTVASTSPSFIGQTGVPVPVDLDAYTITEVRCYAEGGTSKVIQITDGTNAMEAITCGTSVTSDDGSLVNNTVTAAEKMYLDFGATSGEVHFVSVSVFGTITRE